MYGQILGSRTMLKFEATSSCSERVVTILVQERSFTDIQTSCNRSKYNFGEPTLGTSECDPGSLMVFNRHRRCSNKKQWRILTPWTRKEIKLPNSANLFSSELKCSMTSAEEHRLFLAFSLAWKPLQTSSKNGLLMQFSAVTEL